MEKEKVEKGHVVPSVAFFMFSMLFMFFAFVFTSCSKDDDSDKAKDESVAQTVLVYMAAENSLSIYATYDMQSQKCDADEMLESVKAMSDNDRLVLFIDDTDLPRIYVLTNKTKASRITQMEADYTFPNDVDSCSPATLKQVLDWARSHCPADEYGLVFWSHGSGWMPGPKRAFGVDNGKNVGGGSVANVGTQMDISDMATVLSAYPKFDFLFFDACFMQSVELCYELRHCASRIMGSPAEIPALGAPYSTLMYRMFSATGANPSAMMQCYFDAFSEDACLLSVVDCNQLDALATLTAQLLEKYSAELSAMDWSAVLNYFDYDKYRSLADMPDCYDMLSIMKHLLSETDFKQWKEAFVQAVPTRLASAFTYTMYGDQYIGIDKEEYGGLTMYLPLFKYKDDFFYSDYWKTSWANKIQK